VGPNQRSDPARKGARHPKASPARKRRAEAPETISLRCNVLAPNMAWEWGLWHRASQPV
jgi:hypothetical protein